MIPGGQRFYTITASIPSSLTENLTLSSYDEALDCYYKLRDKQAGQPVLDSHAVTRYLALYQFCKDFPLDILPRELEKTPRHLIKYIPVYVRGIEQYGGYLSVGTIEIADGEGYDFVDIGDFDPTPDAPWNIPGSD